MINFAGCGVLPGLISGRTGTNRETASLNVRLSVAPDPAFWLIMEPALSPPLQGVAMGQKLAKRFMVAFGLGLLLALIFDHSAAGFAVGFAIVFGAGLAAE
ncbi:hypothetical protein SAMN04488563_4398 [Jiangella alkaliphila]|uniref:Uncharacterized protein n=3 Tax=Jiangella TaxID=281472 RepID=A0A1H2KWA2_9ACTN|nr:hypothetical protein SAMN04488563_4398 [Jiangella alkaliphila]